MTRYEVTEDIPGDNGPIIPQDAVVELIESEEQKGRYVALWRERAPRADAGGSIADMTVQRAVTLTQAKVDKYLKPTEKRGPVVRAMEDPNYVLEDTDDADRS